jgi:molybdenum cofactor biosynthesis protein B
VKPSVEQHREAAPDHVRIAVVTVSDTRTPENDTGGDVAEELLRAAGHEVVHREIVKDDPPAIEELLKTLLSRADVDAAVTTGGTGISGRDTTYEVATRLIGKRLDGFGELFRMLSYEEIGSAAMLSRAVAGTVETPGGTRLLACLPGSSAAVRLGVEKLLAPEVSHVVFELRKHAQ